MITFRHKRDQRGVTIMELMMALTASFIVVMGLGKLVMLNQQAFQSSRGKSDIQINSSLILDQMSRSVRESQRIVVTSSTEFATYDSDGNVMDSFQWTGAGGQRIQRDGVDMTTNDCSFFRVSADADTISLTLEFELVDNDQASMRILSQVGRRVGQGAAPGESP